MAETVLRRKWHWAEKMIKMNNQRWSKKMLYFDPVHLNHGEILKRKRGRPRISWHTNINTFCKHMGFNGILDFIQEHGCRWRKFTNHFIEFTLYHPDDMYFDTHLG